MNKQECDKLVGGAFRPARSSADEDEVRELVFHLNDCADDLARVTAVWSDPLQFTEDEVKAALDGLLLHAAGHIVRAARLYGGFIDTFAQTNDEPENGV